MQKLTEIQNLVHVSKSERNSFGNYNYRTCEGIFLTVKPFLKELNLTLNIKDKLIIIEGAKIIKSIAILIDNETKDKIYSIGYAEINVNTKGMHVAQCYGASTSYARKYALQGLFLLDDAQDDIDSKDNTKANNKENLLKNSTRLDHFTKIEGNGIPNNLNEIQNKIVAKPYFSKDNFDKAYKNKATFDDIRKYYIMSEKIKQDYLLFIAEQTKNEINTNV